MHGSIRLFVIMALIAATGGAGATASAHASDAGPAPFLVGAAEADITPPLAANTATDPANCDTAQTFDGPHLFALEEPYRDTNGNGRFDGGEPFLDCPTPTANGGVRAPDGRWDGIYLGGGDCCNRQPTAVLDRLGAETFVVAHEGKRIAVTTVDNEGVFDEIWDLVRQKVRADGVTDLDASFFSSTHDESAPDTIGISGPNEFTSGVDPFYVEFMVARIADNVERADRRLQPASIRYGAIHPDDLVPCWSSYPYVADEQIGAMQAVDRQGHAVFTLVNYGIHAEELGFSDDNQDRLHLSADWPHFTRAALAAAHGGVVLTMAGAVGSVEMPQVFDTPRTFQPVAEHESNGNGGCRTIYDTTGTTVPYGYQQSTRARGERIAAWASRALETGAPSRSDDVAFARTTIVAHLDNELFHIAGNIGIFAYKHVYQNGQPAPRAANGAQDGDELHSVVGWFSIGDGQFVTAPGEVFPFTYIHSFAGPNQLARPELGPVHGWVMARLSAPWRFIAGLGDDMLGYMFPASNAVDVPTPAHLANDPGDRDRFGCTHPDDGEAAAEGTGDLIDDALLRLLPAPRDATVRVGRYVYADGTFHRSPMGDGGIACSGARAPFTPAPGGAAVGIAVMPAGATAFDPAHAVQYRLTSSTSERGWMDVRGRPQERPSTQTRGIVGEGRRIWVDVFPTR